MARHRGVDRTLDRIDLAILPVLDRDGRAQISRVADAVGLSKSPCRSRVRRLEADGLIEGCRAMIDPVRIGRAHVTFVEVKLTDTSETALSEFNAAVRAVAEIEQTHMIAGRFDYLLKVRTGDIAAYRRVLGERISALPHAAQTSTYLSMTAVKDFSGGLG